MIRRFGPSDAVMALEFKMIPESVKVGASLLTKRRPGLLLESATVNPVGIPSESRPTKEILAPLIANPPTSPLTFLEGVEATAEGVASADVAAAVALALAAALSAPATGVEEISD